MRRMTEKKSSELKVNIYTAEYLIKTLHASVLLTINQLATATLCWKLQRMMCCSIFTYMLFNAQLVLQSKHVS